MMSPLSDVADISLLKIDTQGYEMNVLKGSLKVLQKVRYILIEVHFLRTYKIHLAFSKSIAI